MASCIMYDPAILPTFDIVFDGTVTAIDGDQVTFKVTDGWKGVDGSVTLTAPDLGIALVGPHPGLRGRRPIPRHRSRLEHQRVRLHPRL